MKTRIFRAWRDKDGRKQISGIYNLKSMLQNAIANYLGMKWIRQDISDKNATFGII